MKKLTLTLAWLVLLSTTVAASAAEARRDIHFPDLPGLVTLKCDLHMHTVFSDGAVWPAVRVQEAWRQGLDAIAITDHIEYQPHKDDVPTKLERPYELAQGLAREKNVLLIRGAEITRDTPPGHFNAVFLQKVAPLETPEFVDAIKQANEQGAFVFWNHQGWKGEEKGSWLEVHTQLLENRWLHGMEVCNGDEYYPTAHRWCLEKNLTMLGNSDIHDPDLRRENTPADHRTLTLVFAKERTPAAIHEALKEGRTAVWFEGQIIGPKSWLERLFSACVRVKKPHLAGKDAVWVEVQNVCDLDIKLQRPTQARPTELVLPARSTIVLKIGTKTPAQPTKVSYTAANFVIAPDQGLPVALEIPGAETK